MAFAGSTAIVTGGASGIGLAISERLARDGAKVAVFDLDLEQAERAAQGIRDDGRRGDRVRGRRVGPGAGRRRGRADPRRAGSGAGAGQQRGARTASTAFMDISPELWERIIAVNLTGTFHCTQAALPDMLAAKWGRIVNISSSSAADRRGDDGALLVVEGRHDRPHQDAGARARAARASRSTPSRPAHRHADEPPRRRRRAIRRRHPRRRRPPPPRAPHRHPGGHRGSVRVPRVRRGRAT